MKEGSYKFDEVVKVFRKYGFDYKPEYSNEKVAVFTISQGFFNNAVVVKKQVDADSSEVKKNLSEIGFATQDFPVLGKKNLEDELFKGFFGVERSKQYFNSEYNDYVSKVIESFPSEADQYSYVNAPFLTSRDDDGVVDKTLVDCILEDVFSDGPKLIVVEAAAGFGKTSTAYEIGKKICESNAVNIPLFAELARDRKAKIFRHILLNEIDRRYPTLSSELVVEEIKNNRVIMILDGFDELLSESEDEERFENSEAMLETIGELLERDAKVILTTRKTAILEGDDFYDWMYDHSDDFDVIRYSILEPQTSDWLDQSRIDDLEASGLSADSIANPVILSYLRYLSDVSFDEIKQDVDSIVDMYFKNMLEREQTRQGLRMSPDQQAEILLGISERMVDGNFTKDTRENLVKSIVENHGILIDEVRQTYSAAERPNREELANTLANHALLDRSSGDEKIGFVNDFVLGNFVAEKIVCDDEWWGDEIFIESAITSYSPRTSEKKKMLWSGLQQVLGAIGDQDQLKFEQKLSKTISRKFKGANFRNLALDGVELFLSGHCRESFFYECTFRECLFDFSNIDSSVFVGCRFFDCKHNGVTSNNEFINCIVERCSFDPELDNAENVRKASSDDSVEKAKVFVLERFWPTGKDSIAFAHRPLNLFFGKKVSGVSNTDIDSAISELKSKGIIVDAKRKNWVGVNTSFVAEISNILGRS